MKTLVIGTPSYFTPFTKYGEVTDDVSILSQCGLVVFTGGEDVDPSLYGESKDPKTYSNIYRDEKEILIYKAALSHNIPMVGICRGAQFLCVMNGGKLTQHIEDHQVCNHLLLDIEDGTTLYDVTSDHHQEMVPCVHSSRVLAFGRAKHTLAVEVVYWERTNSLGVQFHPEWTLQDSKEMQYFHKLLDTHVLNKEEESYEHVSYSCGC